MLNTLLPRLLNQQSLNEEEMMAAVGQIMDGAATPVSIAAFLVALRCKGESIEEITGAARAMRLRMVPIRLDETTILDTCGTGGDSSGTFNISTASAFVLATAGITVAKHGNRAVSSRSGSADVLAAAGVNIDASKKVVEFCLHKLGIAFLFAPLYHPAMKHAAPVRKELGIRTLFNVLGPLCNPASATHQILGVFDLKLTHLLAQVLAKLGSTRAWVVHGEDGLDELSVCASTHIAEWDGTKISERTLQPEHLGLPRYQLQDLKGGDPTDNAQMLKEVLRGQGNKAIRDAVALNAAAGLEVAGRVQSLAEGLTHAKLILASGKADELLRSLSELSHLPE